MVMPLFPSSPPDLGQEVVSDKDWARPFVELFILISFVIAFVTALIPNPLYNHQVLYLGTLALAGVLLAFRLGAPAQGMVHLTTLIGSAMAIYLIFITGGTVSVVMVIYVGLSWMPFLLLPLKSALAWLIAQVNALLLIFLASQLGWIHSRAMVLPEMAVWTCVLKVQAAFALIFILDFFDRSRQQHIAALQARGDELQALHLELIRAQSHKDEFIASVGHELRTPMNAILGLNGVLKDQIKDNPMDIKRVDMIRKSTQHLLSVVNDILDFSQLQADRMVLAQQAFPLKEQTQAWIAHLNARATSKNLKAEWVYDADLPDWILTDAKRFHQMVDNLLENALKFTHQGSITLRFLHILQGLRIEVQDTGIGMTEEQTAQAFGRFEKSTKPALKMYGGTGLGLSICEKLVRLQGGRIGVESQFNQGSLFWLEIPLTPTAAPLSIHPTTASNGNGKPKHFLIVDDHPVNLMVAKRMVEKSWPQARVDTQNSGEAALRFIQEHDVDMVLMDMFMPDMDGMEVTRAIRMLPAPKNALPVLGLTASSNASDHAQCMAAGMNGMVFKPLESQALEKGVALAMQHKVRA
jgi:signal transduction histidine kinase/ActR/RegA family two-component response regulator